MLQLDGNSLSISDVASTSRREIVEFSLSTASVARVESSRKLVDKWVAGGETIYGITTGFGEFANVSIPLAQIKELQQNLLRSHSAGVGIPLRNEVVRAMLLLRANALAKGYSGVRPRVIEQLLTFLRLDLLPVIPSRGSVGSSGDLAPLAHLALALTGEGLISIPSGNDRKVVDAEEALKEFNIAPLKLEAKEGLALINGTQMMSAIGCLALDKARRLAMLADVSASMSFEALRATDKAFSPYFSEARPHIGQREVAEHMLRLTHNSEIRNSHLKDDPRVQDAYSLRCIPQVHGAVRDTIRFVENVLATEINSATDNPLIIPTEDGTGIHLEGGNFHGEPLALALDYLAIATSELASISERRTERLVNGALSFGLPRFLTPKGGLHSGLMIAQYTAASLVSENKVLSHPASVDSIPTSANQEDHNSMGSVAALKLEQVIDNVETVLAIEMLCASQGIDFLKPLKPGVGSGAAHRAVRSIVPFLEDDRNTSTDIAKVKGLVSDATFISRIEGEVAGVDMKSNMRPLKKQ
ncbi:MAG: histidine ammonia-lyase [Bacteroidota bacterium]|nr:histidine ammonia-lyase [Bacteroidota bacterium]